MTASKVVVSVLATLLIAAIMTFLWHERHPSQPAASSARVGDAPKRPEIAAFSAIENQPPPLEVERAKQEEANTGQVIGPASEAQANVECATAPGLTKISDTHFSLTFPTKVEYMFGFRLTGVAGKTVRIDCQNVQRTKWKTLNPVYRYADEPLAKPLDLNARDITLAESKTTTAYNGAELPDTSNQPWHFISNAWTDDFKAMTTLSFVQKFDKDDVYIAMRPPFTLSDEAALVEQVKGLSGVEIIDLGKSRGGNPLQIIKVSAGEATEHENPCIVIYAREHADEQDSSWVLAGAMQRVLRSDTATLELRKHFTFLFIPILDPDAAAKCLHESIIVSFRPDAPTPESIAYATFFQKWVRSGKRLDIVFNFHNVESNEAPHFHCPLQIAAGPLQRPTKDLYAAIAHALSGGGYLVVDKVSGISTKPSSSARRSDANKGYTDATGGRLGGWLNTIYGAVHLPMEGNAQEPHRHLNMREVCALGSEIIIAASGSSSDSQGKEIFATVSTSRNGYNDRWKLYGHDLLQTSPFVGETKILEAKNSDDLLDALLSPSQNNKAE